MVSLLRKGKDMNNPKLSIIIPAYNEEENLKRGCLNTVFDYFQQKKDFEVLIVDDGSKDKTIEVIKKLIKEKKGFRLIENQHGGKAITVMTGLLKSQGEIALFTDMDQATPITELEKILPKFSEGFDVVIGSRHGRKGAPAIRKLMALGFAILRNIMVGLPFSDTQCGFKAFNRKAINLVFPQILERWQSLKTSGAAVNAGFDVEMLFFAKKKDLKITEVGVQWHHVGSARVQLIKDSIDAIKDMLRIKINDLMGRYS